MENETNDIKNETFLETEIIYLSQRFDVVYLIPGRLSYSNSWFTENKSDLRLIPENCKIILPPSNNSWVRIFVKYFFRIFIESEIFVINEFLSPKYLYTAIRETVKSTIYLAKNYEFFAGLGKNIIAYSYWKSDITVALVKLKQEGIISKVITRAHGGDLYYIDTKNKPFENYLINACDHVVAIAEDGYNYLLKLGYLKDKILLSRLGIDDPKSRSMPSTDGILHIVSCSNVIPVKRVDLIAGALSKLLIPFQWVHFGDGIEMVNIKSLIKHFPIHGKAVLKGRVCNSEIYRYYEQNTVDLFINVSSSEGLPVSIMEAMFYGIPCIVTNVGGCSELVDDSVGKLIRRDIAENELASIIEQEISNRKMLLEKRNSAAQKAKQMVNAEINYTEFASFLRTVTD